MSATLILGALAGFFFGTSVFLFSICVWFKNHCEDQEKIIAERNHTIKRKEEEKDYSEELEKVLEKNKELEEANSIILEEYEELFKDYEMLVTEQREEFDANYKLFIERTERRRNLKDCLRVCEDSADIRKIFLELHKDKTAFKDEESK